MCIPSVDASFGYLLKELVLVAVIRLSTTTSGRSTAVRFAKSPNLMLNYPKPKSE